MAGRINLPAAGDVLKRVLKDRVTQRLLFTYAAIGTTVFALDFGVFQVAIVRGLPALAASTLSYFTGAVAHFTLNKYFNFRSFERALHQQAGTYAVIIAAQWLATLLIVGICVAHHMPPLLARLVAVLVVLPASFFAHRYLTFGAGILGTLTRLRKASK
ncbi:MAG: GtrA family protein [Vulcanimicrobiaceae bacterium]|jgi:putative flippase GtrA